MILNSYGNRNGFDSDGLVLQIKKPFEEIDSIAIEALKKTQEKFKQLFPSAKNKILTTEGLSRQVIQVTQRLNDNRNLDVISRLLLSSQTIYTSLIQLAKEKDQVLDADGLYDSITTNVFILPRKFFLATIAESILESRHIKLEEFGQSRRQRLAKLILERGLLIKSGELLSSFLKLLDVFYTEGNIPDSVDEYLEQRKIPNFTSKAAIRQAMIDYLLEFGVPDDENQEGDSQNIACKENFAIAYNEAIKRSKKPTNDPIDAAYGIGGYPKWDFSIDRFNVAKDLGINESNICAAGALDYIYYIGECLHVFDVANVLVLRWASGILDIPEGETAQKLYRFHKLRDDRNSPEERAMLYKRVLNKGDGAVLQNMVVNEAFPIYWEQLMAEVVQYTQKAEGKSNLDSWSNAGVSKARIYQLTRNLQRNLTEYMTGMAHLQVHEDYAHLQEALEIIKSDDIRNYYGGRRLTPWDLIERIVKEEFGIAVQTEAIKTLAVEGNKVFVDWIAKFDERVDVSERFDEFCQAAEAWIIAQASISSGQFAFAPISRLSAHSQTTPSNNGRGLTGLGSVDNDFDDW